MMVGQVYATLVGIFAEHGHMQAEEAILLIQEMETARRLQVDCWGVTLHHERIMEQLENKCSSMALQWLKKTFTKSPPSGPSPPNNRSPYNRKKTGEKDSEWRM